MAVAVAAAAAAGACRPSDDALTPPRPEFPLESGDLRRLTYNPNPDVSPLWTPDGAGVSYQTQGLPPAAIGRWLRAQVPAAGGAAHEELPEYRLPGALETLSLARAIGRDVAALAYVQYAVPCACMLDSQPGIGVLGLVEVPLGIPPAALSSLRQAAVGLVGLFQTGLVGPFPLYRINMLPPFQRRVADHANPFGPSWAPGGERLVVSSGDSLYVWTVADSSLVPVPGVGDASFPRWSPDGQWIAFTRYPRDSVAVRTCNSAPSPFAQCFNELHIYRSLAPEVWLVRPDGAELQRVTFGEESAWFPDSRLLVIRRASGLVLRSLQPATETELANTAGAGEPAVSPDGRAIVFVSRRGGNLDLWTKSWAAPGVVPSR